MRRPKPLQIAEVAKPHRPVYRMHRYYARRPYNVFARLIEHYTNPGDVILDPFCGGGVTIVESLSRGRKAIGIDTNPLAVFVTEMEVRHVDVDELQVEIDTVVRLYEKDSRRLFQASCGGCGQIATAKWFELTAIHNCTECGGAFPIASATKIGPGKWECTRCHAGQRHSSRNDTEHVLTSVLTSCEHCEKTLLRAATDDDHARHNRLAASLRSAESRGLWLPDVPIPDCNMQRESALHSKGITSFRQLFSDRQLLSLALLKRAILKRPEHLRDWLLFAFSSTLRYCNRMVTRNPGWRGQQPLEWAKPGFWLPSVYLEANVLEQFTRRCAAVLRGKRDFQRGLGEGPPPRERSIRDVIADGELSYCLVRGSSAYIAADDKSVDAIITDPPYGSYVHYADLSNFWSAWLPEIRDMGGLIDQRDEAVIARKRFPGAKSIHDYTRLLESCLRECSRVLKDSGCLVLTFHNREPRAWASLLVAAWRAGFQLPPDGVLFQPGVSSYRHTAQSRRGGSVIGDFILTFNKLHGATPARPLRGHSALVQDELLRIAAGVLDESGSLSPDELLRQVYCIFIPRLMERIVATDGATDGINALLGELDHISLFDSHRRVELERHFRFRDGKWKKHHNPRE